ncbi:pectinesterase [Coffea arabica]|uniref:Pectinesterase n=1 Tax=Coffea arabica TaxID=13443 RepID=A0A6P6WH32_COFAR|nr:pectinesterase-like [Coffea arabica]
MKTMQSKTCIIFALLLLFSFFFTNHASSPPPPSAPSNPQTVCSYTPFPYFCRSTLPNNRSATIHDYCRYSVYHSLSMTNNFLSLVNRYLRLRFAFTESTIRALQDCQTLASLSRDFLSNTIQSIGSTTTLQSSQADYMQTLLSATLTNYQTCLDGLKETTSSSSVSSAFLAPLTNGSMSFSVSLALFMHGYRQSRRSLSELNSDKSFGWGRRLLQQIGNNNAKVNQMVVVDPNGNGTFTTISDAVAAAPNNTAAGKGYFMIYVVAGVYEEYVTIASNKKYIMLVGDGINQTIITGNRSVVDGWTTFNSATLAVTGQGFVGMNITIRNTAGAVKHQAVAVRNGADLSTFYNCSFEGYQDTLYTHSLRQFYKQCDVYGTVDFIFGNAAVVFQNCNLYPRLPMQGQFNAITAQGRTDINQNTGTSIQNCNIMAAPDLASSNGTTKTYLGRPWKEYSRTVYMQSFLGSLIDPAGWTPWSGDFALSTLYYAEYDNSGPGSDTTSRVTWPGYHVINAADAANFTVANFILGDNWLPQTGVTYTSGLL